MRFILKISLSLLFAVGIVNLQAQEFWLQFPRHFVAVGSRQNLHVFVGEYFTGTPWSGRSARLTRLVQHTATDTMDLTAAVTTPDTLHTSIRFPKPGLHLLALTTTTATTELAADKFTAYLLENGLDNALALRRQHGQTHQPGREVYRRCAKTLVVAGNAGNVSSDSTFAHFTGQPLELIPEQNPYSMKPGAALTLRLLYEGKPLRRALVQVWQRGVGGSHVTRRTKLYTNQNGRVLFHLSAPGSYMVSAVYIAPYADRQTADWQSTWTTLTFGIAPQDGPKN